MANILRILTLLIALTAGWSSLANAATVNVGDVIRVSLPGEESLDNLYEVDQFGRINLPEVGPLEVAGVDSSLLTELIQGHLAVAFRDLTRLDASIHQRRILMSVLGYVEKPGQVVLSANDSIQTALTSAGGLRAGARLDNFRIKRPGEEDIVFDYKAYLDSGDEKLLPKLRSLDVLFIPASPLIGNIETNFDPKAMNDKGDASDTKKSIKVFGEVRNPGSFTYKEEQELDIVDFIMRSGGVTQYATIEQIRILSDGEPTTFNLKTFLDSGDKSLLPGLKSGATIFVPRQQEEIKAGGNMIYVMGEVARPGAFEGNKGATFMDIISNSGGPTRFADSRQIRIIRADSSIVPFDLTAFLEGTSDQKIPEIIPGDAIFVPEKINNGNEASWLKVSPLRAVHVIGAVNKPGRTEWSDEMSLLDLIAHVGGPNRRADTSHIEILIPNEDGSTRSVAFNLDEHIKLGKANSALPKIVAGSVIRFNYLPDDPSDNKSQWITQSSETSIYLFGQVNSPGRYKFSKDLHFLDILSAADGPSGAADLRNIRISHRNQKYAKVSKVDLALYFETGDESILPKVLPGDSIYIPQKDRGWLDQAPAQTIRVLGAVGRPGRYTFDDKMTILDLLAEAGGTAGGALVEKITIVNLSCCANQARIFDLTEFSKTADFTKLPVLRAGDTVYVPNQSDSLLAKGRLLLNDIFQLASLSSLLGLGLF